MRKTNWNKGGRLVKGLLASAALAAFALAASPAAAQAVDERIWIEVSGFYPRIDTVLDINRTGQPGTVINAEGELGLDESQALPAVYAGWRLGERWVLNGEFYALDREGRKALSRDIVFDGTTYPLGVTLDSAMKSDVYRATLGYSFFKNDQGELGAAIGLHATDFDISVKGEAQVNTTTRQVVTRQRNAVAPMPTIGAYGSYSVSPKVVLNGRVDFLSLDLDEYGGGITNAQASVAYRFTDRFSMGAAYRYVSYDLDINKSDYTADIEYDFSGPSIFLRMSFQ